MRVPKTSALFRKHFKKLKNSGRRDMKKLEEVMSSLIDEEILPEKCKDHSLEGNWKGYRDCHIEGDWLLIYKLEKNEEHEIITFVATGSHSTLF